MFLLQLLGELRSHGVVLWNKGSGQLGFSFPKETGFPDALKERVKVHKAELLALFTLNAIDSEQRARSRVHFKLPREEHARTLESIQKGMYLQSRIDPLPYTYTIPLFVRLRGADARRAHAAITALLEHHAILRMCVAEDLGFTLLTPAQLPIEHARVSEDALGGTCETRARMGFAPGAPLIRPEVWELEGTPDVVVSLCHHHMLSDAYSSELLVQQLLACYDGALPATLASGPDALDYFDHALHQRMECASPAYVEARRVLVGKLEQAEKLQLKRKALTSQENHARTLRFALDPADAERLRALATEHQLGLYSLLFTALYQTLATFSNGEPGFPVGLTVANRPEEFRQAIGPFINTLPLIPEYKPSDSFLLNAQRVQQEILYVNQHHQLNLNMLAEQMRNSAELPELMQVLFTLHNFKPVEPHAASVAHEVLPVADLAEKFGITLVAKDHGERVSFTLTYAHASFEDAFIQTLVDSYVALLTQLAPDTLRAPAHHLSPLGPTARRRVLEDWNQTDAAFEHHLTAAQLFERQVEKTPDHLAVIFQDRRLTYRQLNARANQLAHWLRTEGGVTPERLVCLCLERSEDMLVAVLGVLKAGCAYVPIDPGFPAERLAFLLEDTQAPLLITQERYQSLWNDRRSATALLCIDSARSREALARQPVDNLPCVVSPQSLAYVIYTSGTTGKPKGVMSEHAGLVNRIQWMNTQYPLRESDRVLQKTTYVFDVSVWELIWANWYGACIVFAEPEGHKDADYLLELIERESINVIHFVPSMFGVFLDNLRARAGEVARPRLSSLRYIFCSGEALKLKHVQDTHALLPHAQLHNLYGPTEASIDVLYFDCTDRSLDAVPIGKPIDNTQVYVLNEAMRPLPVYGIGELFLGGVGLARGYLNRPELTAQRFVANPFAPAAQAPSSARARLYRTGDLVRWLPDGNIEYLGRNDFQVKIRGQRIELGEIETALAQCAGVRQGLALVRTPKGEPGAPQLLVGYYVAERPLDEAALVRQLNEKLPPYMVPTALVHLTHVPLTTNGKLDRNALPEPRWVEREQYVPPRDEREERLRAVWAESLGLEAHRLGIRDDLFSLGMDSIIAIQLVSRLRQRLSLTVSVKDVFAHKTLEHFHDHLLAREAERTRAATLVTEQGPLKGELGLLPIQSWFFAQDFVQPAHWNQAFLVKTPALEPERLEAALRALVRHHDAFRLRYEPVPGQVEPRQYYAASAALPPPRRLDIRELRAAEGSEAFQKALREHLTEWQGGFDLERGPLSCFGYLHGYADGSARLFFALHHLIVDTVSWHVLVEDLQALYEQRPLGDKGSSYRQWVDRVADHARAHESEREFWRQLLADDRSAEHAWLQPPRAGASHSSQLRLDKAATDALLKGAHRAYHTQVNDLLLTAIGQALREVDGAPVHHLMVEGHGREELDPSLDITRTLGWFTTLYPVRLDVEGSPGEGLKRVKESLRALPTKGLGFGALLGYRERPLPPLCFNYLGQLDREGAPQAWRILAEDSGDAMPARNTTGVRLDLFAFVVDGCFHLRLDSRLDAAWTETFRQALEHQLTALLAHCLARAHGEYTPSDFQDVASEADLSRLPLLPHPDRAGWFAMTEIQKAYLIGRLGHYEIGNVANHIYNEYQYRALDTGRLEVALNQLIARCEVLRTVYSIDRLQQRYLTPDETPPYVLQVNDFGTRPHDAALLEPIRERLSHQVYDAERFPLFTFEVSRFADRCVLHVSIDLIILDVQSRLMLFGLLDDLYRGVDIQARLPRVKFKDYQDHAGLLRHSRWYQNDRAYWQARLPSLPLRPTLAFKQAPETITQPRFAEHTLYVEPGTWAKFKAQAQRHNVSYSSALLGLFGSLISYFSGSREFLITLTLFNRYAVCEDVGSILGDFTSTTLFHFAQEARDARTLLRRTHDVLWEDISHALYSGLDVQRELSRLHGLDAHKAVSPIIFTGVVGNQTRQFERAALLEDGELIDQRYWCAQTSQAWIDLQAIEVGDRFMSKWLYVEQLFEPGYIEHLNRLYVALIEHLAEHDWRDELPFERYLPERDRALIAAANQATLGPSEDTLFGAYERHCQEAGLEPAVAVVDLGLGERFTYGTLLAHGERLAHVLHRLGTSCREADGTPVQLVGVLIEKGYHQVLACCAIMKAGYAYLPMHSDWPAGRVDDVMSQAGASLLLVSRAQYEDAEVQAVLKDKYRLLVIEDELARSADTAVPAAPLPRVSPDAVAYVIFTSGSTGKPKGVTISHRGALNTLRAVNQRFCVSAADKVLALSELSFDLSVYDLFGLLAVGGQIVFVPPRATKDPSAWLEAIERERITLWNTVPQLAGLLVDALQHGGKTSHCLRVFMLSGDWVPTRLPVQLMAAAPQAEVMSLGGATEGSIWSIWYPVEAVPPEWTSIPYGIAMPNQKMYVLSDSLQHCPVGVTGEIYIGGMGVALNYWRDEALTRARYGEYPRLGRLYKTGDLGRWSKDGYIEFLGRNDFQVKLRGHRVELGEIENALLRHPEIKQSVVLVREQPQAGGTVQTLVGYYVAERALEEHALLEQLANSLPEYMVPAALVHLRSLPLTANGKLDRKALPEPGLGQGGQRVAPRDEHEAQLRAIWARVLGLPEEGLGIRDDLLRLGMDSIVSIQLVGRLRQHFGVKLGVRDIFAHKTIERFYDQVLRGALAQRAPSLHGEQGPLQGEVPLLPIQAWFFANRFPREHHWNQSFLVKTPVLCVDQLQERLDTLVARHDVFSLRYRLTSTGEPVQFHAPDTRASSPRCLDVRSLGAPEGTAAFERALHERLTEWQSGFDLEQGPTHAFGYLEGYQDGSSRVFFALHHLIVDTVSWRILAEDLATLCQGGTLGAKGSSFRQWVGAVAEHGRTHEAERAYWKGVLADHTPAPALPADAPTSELSLVFDEALTRRLLRDSPRAYNTQVGDVLLTAFAHALRAVTGEAVHHIVMEGHGREDLDARLDISRTVGWFTSMFPVRLSTQDDPIDSLQAIKDMQRGIPDKGVGFGALFGYAPEHMPRVCFNYLGQFGQDERDPGFWRLAQGPTGVALHADNVLPYGINLAGMVLGGQLRFQLTCRLGEAKTRALAHAFEETLSQLVRRTAECTRRYLTPSDLELRLSPALLERLQAERDVEEVFLANSLQQGFIYHALQQGAVDEAYRVQAIWDYQTAIDPALLEEAWRRTQQAHGSLRLRFDWSEELLQVIDRHGQLTWHYEDLSGLAPERQEERFARLLERDRTTPYDLAAGSLFRVYLLKRGARHYTCLFNTHHGILDGWSSPLLLDTLHGIYLALQEGRTVEPPLDSYPASQRYLQRHTREHEAFWTRYLEGIEGGGDLGGLLREGRTLTDIAQCKHVRHQGQRRLALEPARLETLRETARAAGVTLNVLLQFAWHKVLAVFGRASQTVVGTVVAGRDLPVDHIERSVGLHLNTLPLRVQHTATTVREELLRLQDDINEINPRSTIDLASLQRKGERLFDSLFIYENYPNSANAEHDRRVAAVFKARHEKRDYPLVVAVGEHPDGLLWSLDFAEELFEPAAIERLLACVEWILGQLQGELSRPSATLSLLSERDQERMLRRWNATTRELDPAATIHQAFEHHAAATPDAVALETRDRVLTYRQLNGAANQVARHALKHQPLRTEEPVVLLVDRGEFTVMGLLAILKAGGAYIPLEPDYPDDRIARILEDSRARLVLTQAKYQQRLERLRPGVTAIALEGDTAAWRAEDPANLERPVSPEHLAYILYTSGTTGQPKGVMIEHRAYLGTLLALRAQYFPTPGPLSTFSMTRYVFDIFGLEYGLTLLSGGRLHLDDPLFSRLDCAAYDFVQMTPSLLEMKLDALVPCATTKLLVGGEKLERSLLHKALDRGFPLVNVYGPTETTIWSTSRSYVGRTPRDVASVTIGRPLANETAYILDAWLRPLPVGAIGELHLGGEAVARGYFNRPELTAERFIANPFQDEDERLARRNARLYKTGDLARWREDGEIEFLGRLDNQIKLRGYRIELGEIEAAIARFPGVKQGLARIASLGGAGAADQVLLGYYLAETVLDEGALGAHLATLLPDYMRPNALVHLRELPLTVNGKLDVRALPLPGKVQSKVPTPPRGELEIRLAELWKEVLGLERVGIHDRFFELGGNSILLTKLYVRLPESLRERVSMVDLFKYPTIAMLGEHLRANTPEPQPRAPERTAAPVAQRDIAIIGMAGRFPMADDLEEFWDNLVSGHEATCHYSREELAEAGVPPRVLDQPGYVRAQSRLRDFKHFDAAFFGYSPREAELMDPQHRLFLECAWHALEDAHCDPFTYAGDIGLYAGVGQNNYERDYIQPSLEGEDLSSQYQVMINTQANFLCTKVAYKLNLTGPALTVQTACSSSLVAVHQACLALQAGDCDIAMAGGVSIGKLEKEGYLYQDGLIFSPDGRCRAFDSSAQGTFEGQGVGLVVLKPLAQALADGDEIRAVIKATAINNDGRDKIGYTAPSQKRQADVIRAAHRKAGIRPDSISYIEAHGTGTVLGDPIEFEGLKAAFGAAPGATPFCALGSVKTNIGHLDVAAGIAGLIKTVLCLENQTLVPTLHFKDPNPRLGLTSSPFYVNTETRPWTARGPLRAGVSSFGIGGTNAHVVLEQAPDASPRGRPTRRPEQDQHLLVLSAHTAPALEQQAARLSAHLRAHPELALDRVAYTLQVARHRFAHQRIVVGADREALLQALAAPGPVLSSGPEAGPVIFMFPGQGAQYAGMGRALYTSEPRFREQVDRCLAILRPHLGADEDEADLLGWSDRVHHTRLTQPALFILEYALARWFIDLGLQPAAMIGHSLGEYVAACLAGVFSLEDALPLVLERGRLLASLPESRMLAVPRAAEALRHRVEPLGLDIAVINDGASCVLSGTAEAIERIAAELAREGVDGKPLKVSHAFHSRLLEPVLERYQARVAQLQLRTPRLPFISNLSGTWADPTEVTTARYWTQHLRHTVRFHEGLTTLLEDARLHRATCLELGPSQILSRLVRRHPSRGEARVVSSQPRAEQAEHAHAALVTALGQLWAAGHALDSDTHYGLSARDRVRLPAYAFVPREHWVGAAPKATPAPAEPVAPPEPTTGDGLMELVAELWHQLLGVRDAGLDDDFFAQGGDSLTAVRLVAAIERRLGLKLEFMSLEQHSIRAITQRLRQHLDGHTFSGNALVVIKKGQPQVAPLVLVHPIGGDVYFYRELAGCLPAEQPVYAIRSPMLDGGARFESIEAMAEAYLALLESQNLHPPYRLGGSSFGGIVAYHMAGLVARRHGSAPELVMVDSPAQGHLPQAMDELETLDYLARYGLGALPFSQERLDALPGLEEKIQYLADCARGTAFEDMLSAEFLPRFIRTWQHHGALMRRYVPEPHAGPLLFFSHQEPIAEFPTGQFSHWKHLIRGRCEEIVVPGNHLSMNALPHVAHIAAALPPSERRPHVPTLVAPRKELA